MRKVSLIALFLLFCGAFAAAQKVELGAGWNYLHIDSDALPEQNGVPGGFFIDGTYYFAKIVGLTGDFEYNKKTFNGDIAGNQIRAFSFHGGPRVKARMGRMEPFAHLLFGVSNLDYITTGGVGTSQNAFSMKLGGGLDVAVVPHFALRLGEFNYYYTRFPATFTEGTKDSQNNVTFSVGVVIR